MGRRQDLLDATGLWLCRQRRRSALATSKMASSGGMLVGVVQHVWKLWILTVPTTLQASSSTSTATFICRPCENPEIFVVTVDRSPSFVQNQLSTSTATSMSSHV
ncbi:hypothetical protein AVEN_257049-1 [Araneus ventricosus]|uniref:Uncharacterized protein n=1 Tax=Araneus ventricosus TaxID=182803 RepID=A0A4Y2U8B5_ARAVE|nr:hypothetical protein AVEN_257049-1 [Araneus ventricosus]